MNYWWVNQNQTSAQEIDGGYLWSPKLNQVGQRQASYENMKEIEPGDLVLAYSNKEIGHYGIAIGRAISSPKPEEFGKAGSYWSDDGWYVPVKWEAIDPIERDAVGKFSDKIFHDFENPFDVKLSIKQRYLCKITKTAVDFVLNLSKIDKSKVADESLLLEPTYFAQESVLDGYVEKSIIQNTDIETTEKRAVILARRGQGKFRENLLLIEKNCRLTRVEDHKLLVASHIKPWRSCASNFERLDVFNGLLLTPTMDRLFDHRYLTKKGLEMIFSKAKQLSPA